MPDSLISMSGCICEFVPDLWAIEAANLDWTYRLECASKFGISDSQVPKIIAWMTPRLEDEIGWPGVFYRQSTAREFADRFLRITDLCLVELALHDDWVKSYLDEIKTDSKDMEYGVNRAIHRKERATESGIPLGWEVLGYEFGGFHSWLCNGLEKKHCRGFANLPRRNGVY